MTIPLLICDDSHMARKQIARSLPDGWDVAITYASDGQQGIDAARAGQAEILFLDLVMPLLDGYAVLEAIQREQLNCLVIVISGDLQPEARERVLQLGALAFIKKPVNKAMLAEVLQTYGLL